MLELCYQTSPEFPLLHSRKYKLKLSEQNNKPLNSVQFKEHFLNCDSIKDSLFKSNLIQEQKLSKFCL